MKFFGRQFFVSALALSCFVAQNSASAVSLNDALASRDAFAVGDVDNRSYDGMGFNAFQPFVSNVNPQLFQAGTFTGAPNGSTVQFFMLSEVAAYDGNDPNFSGNTFGVLNSSGNYIPVFGAADGPGAAASLNQGGSEALTFALQSPEGLFSSVDGDNPDKAAHFLAMTVDKPGMVTIDKANLRGASMSFNLQFGDVVLFIEDLLAYGNILGNGVISDFDYNDMIVVVRSTPVPEPGTLLLLAPALLATRRFRRRLA